MVKVSQSPELQECEKLLEKYTKDPDSEPFLEPVLWKEWGLMDYPKLIKKPMDLGTVRKHLTSGKYNTAGDFAKEVKLIWKNCMTYNADDSDYYKLAQKLDKGFEKDIQKVFKKFGKGNSAVKTPSLDEKANFCRKLYEVSEYQLGSIVQMLDDECQKSLDKSKTDEVEINLDIIDPPTFRKLEAYVKDCLNAEKGKKKIKLDTSIAATN